MPLLGLLIHVILAVNLAPAEADKSLEKNKTISCRKKGGISGMVLFLTMTKK